MLARFGLLRTLLSILTKFEPLSPGLLALLQTVPFLGMSAAVLLPLLFPLFLVLSVYYGIKIWNGDEVRVPIVSDFIDERLPAQN